ncbi:hypothetical protein ACFQY7_56375 [Actinomadura luteofluorescens]|uniref:Secreted protein n=1 Tax=Actinomadura luteofluorescens TaxID=46163 RepID=A0A7Y9EDD3_9ACTN|nr:hypothetical protein [Actinomadura luteofluorescens]NYD45691.1 hypothetical protein [Actinomadura luteofluorescens]NYD45697.1 hypothetical protein [Actinomadura luteofluorescens]NYD45703.1 hypothetical protein [Actinomadura luteofluorescens]
MVTLLLLAMAGSALWAVSVYAYPFRPCSRCEGSGRKHGSTRRRFGPCNRCGGTGRTQRLGSRTAHRTVLSVRSEMAKERQRKRDHKATERATHPRRLHDH